MLSFLSAFFAGLVRRARVAVRQLLPYSAAKAGGEITMMTVLIVLAVISIIPVVTATMKACREDVPEVC